MKASIHVRLKKDVLDPQGEAIKNALEALGFPNITSVRQGKLFDIELASTTREEAESELKKICDKLLVNKIVENYTVDLT